MSYVKDPIYGNHLGIVVNDASFDPEQRGRVQVWIPYLSNTLHSNWNEKMDDKKFKHIHESGALTPELVEELKNVLPWAECAGPIMGGGTSATYNPSTGITDTNPHRTFVKPVSRISNTTKENVKYAYSGGTIRNKPIQDDLMNKLSEAAYDVYGPDAKVVIYSGGQDAIGEGERRTGTPRHDDGFAADVYIEKNGRYLANEETAPMIQYWLANKNGGVGYGMLRGGQKAGLHLDIRKPEQGKQFASTYWAYQGEENDEPAIVKAKQAGKNGVLPELQDSQVTKTAADTAEVAGTTVNAAKTAKEADFTPQDISSSAGISQNLVNAIKVWEGYKDTSGKDNTLTTGGYGTEAPTGTKYTPEQAEAALINDLQTKRLPAVERKLKENNLTVTQAQKEALVSFAFNRNPETGLDEVLKGSSSWDDISSKMRQNFAGETIRNDPNHRYYNGLKNRRESEIEYANTNGAKGGRFNSNGSDSSVMVNPIPNFNPSVIPAGVAGAQPAGFISTPKIGAKVFVFFLAGDIQKPIYFAGLLEKESYQKAQSVASPVDDVTNKTVHRRKEVHGSVNTTDMFGNINGVPVEEQQVSLGKQGSLYQSGAYVHEIAAAGKTTTCYGDNHNQSLGHEIRKVKMTYQLSSEDLNFSAGFNGTEKEINEKLKAQEDIHKISKEIQEEKIKDIESNATKGEKVPCPLCSTSHAVDRASNFAKKVATFLNRVIKLPYFSYVVDVLQFLTTVLVIPFCSVVPGSALGKCGNEECENGMIPSPQKPIEDANKKAAEKLVSKQKEINELEKKLGSGGCYSVAALKDVVISAGGPMNDAKCYAKTTNISEPIGGQTRGDDGKGSTETIRPRSAKNLKNVPYIPPVEYPGGNILLKGGNAVKIIAGAPGIELNTIGKISLNCGSIEILSSDGQLLLGSKNHTTLSGKVVTINANDKTKEGGVNINSPHMICKGFTATGDIGIKGGARIDGELSIPYLNTVSQRMQCDDGMSPDQRIPFANWAIGSAQANDIANTTRLSLTHYSMPGSLLLLSNIIKFVMQTYNTVLTNTILEPSITGIYYGFCVNAAGPGASWGYVQNFHHNHMEDPKPHHHDYIMPKGTYYDDIAGVNDSAVEPNEVPTRARKNGLGPEGGPKSLAGCGGFGGWGGSSGGRRVKLNSFGLDNDLNGFNGTVMNKNNIKYNYNKDGTVNILVNETPCD
jgi:GH24 family phage-related lysozyme (muramidase)